MQQQPPVQAESSENISNASVSLNEDEISLKREQLQFKREALALKRAELAGARKRGSNWSLSPVVTTILAGIVALLGTGVGALTQGWSNRTLERDKFEFNKQIEREKNKANLIVKAVETGDPGKAKTNLLFLVKAGLIEDPGGLISALANDPATVPVLPRPANNSATESTSVRAQPPQALSTTQKFYDVSDGEVTLKLNVGSAVYAQYKITLFDEEGKNPQTVAQRNNADAQPNEFKIGSGRELAGKTLVIRTTMASTTGDPSTPFNIQYLLSGGKQSKTFNLSGVLQNTSINYLSIRFRAQ